MKRVEAKVLQNIEEDPASEPDQQAGTWLIEAKLNEDILDWESARLDFQSSEIAAEIVESTMSGADRFTVRTRGKSPLQKHDVIHVGIRMEREGLRNRSWEPQFSNIQQPTVWRRMLLASFV